MKKFDLKTENEIIELYLNNKNYNFICKKLNICRSSIFKVLKRNNLELKNIKRNNKMEILNICKEYTDGISAPELAKKYNLNASTVINFLRKNKIKIRTASEALRKYEINEDFFDEINSEEKAYFCGWLWADGCMDKKLKSITFQLNAKDKDILYKLSSLIYKEKPEERIKFCKSKREYKNKIKYHDAIILKISSKHFCKKLLNLGCHPNKTLTLKFPEWLDEKLYWHFLRGIFEGDGCISLRKNYHNNSWSLCGSIFICEFLKKSFKEKLNIYSKVEYKKNFCKLIVSGNRQISLIMKAMYDNASIWLDRKRNLWLKHKKQLSQTNPNNKIKEKYNIK